MIKKNITSETKILIFTSLCDGKEANQMRKIY